MGGDPFSFGLSTGDFSIALGAGGGSASAASRRSRASASTGFESPFQCFPQPNPCDVYEQDCGLPPWAFLPGPGCNDTVAGPSLRQINQQMNNLNYFWQGQDYGFAQGIDAAYDNAWGMQQQNIHNTMNYLMNQPRMRPYPQNMGNRGVTPEVLQALLQQAHISGIEQERSRQEQLLTRGSSVANVFAGIDVKDEVLFDTEGNDYKNLKTDEEKKTYRQQKVLDKAKVDFDRLDTNRDGKISKAELTERTGSQAIANNLYTAWNLNEEGGVTLDEYWAQYGLTDHNGDGIIAKEELVEHSTTAMKAPDEFRRAVKGYFDEKNKKPADILEQLTLPEATKPKPPEPKTELKPVSNSPVGNEVNSALFQLKEASERTSVRGDDGFNTTNMIEINDAADVLNEGLQWDSLTPSQQTLMAKYGFKEQSFNSLQSDQKRSAIWASTFRRVSDQYSTYNDSKDNFGFDYDMQAGDFEALMNGNEAQGEKNRADLLNYVNGQIK